MAVTNIEEEVWQMTEKERQEVSQSQKDLTNRLSRIIGHIKAVKTMVESDRDCSEVLIQLAAVKSAINNTGKIILQEYIVDCVEDIIEEKNSDVPLHKQEKKKELNRAIDMFIK